MTPLLLEFQGVRCKIPGRSESGAPEAVDFAVGAGRRVVLLGRSGSGKTLLARLVLGRPPVPPVGVDGTLVLHGPQGLLRTALRTGGGDIPALRALRGGSIGHVPQGGRENLVPGWTILQQLQALPGAPAELDAFVPLLLALGFREPRALLGSRPTELSEGMVRRILLALALVRDPQLVVLDEPTAGLDPAARNGAIDLLGERLTPERGLVLVTHDLALARVLLRDHGTAVLVEDGVPVARSAGLSDEEGPFSPLVAAATALGAWG